MGDWADERAREWMNEHSDAWHSIFVGDEEAPASLAALLREVYEQSHSETLVHCCIHRDEKAPYIQGCECVICHRQRVMAEVRRVVEGVRVTFDGSGPVLACNEILSRLGKL